MKAKLLRPTTIIPADLYVERSADRQLRSIIDDMGRPGYVLVARQMGKTNLLINMKRERNSDIVLYIDLSNRFESARAWFRNLIDALLESYDDVFSSQSDFIIKQRINSELEANVEFDRHLRLLLRCTSKKIIIILDEIDSLVNLSYSDVILAQIRSMYFSRVNYAEYERLTYVLSGVAEPNDLIKDKNISPFNIGEKIYLDDFDRYEFDLFLKKADISQGTEVGDAIFSWANGNPRMTWDICSELEDRIMSGQVPSADMVDSIVEKLYLRDFDRAPVDHIRSLVESDSQIRDAIISIRYGKQNYLDDKTKSKLYLSGITRLSQDGVVEVKNRVIDSALSDRWIVQLNNSSYTAINYASEKYRQDNFEEAVKHFEIAFSDVANFGGLSTKYRIEFGLSYFYLGNYIDAIKQIDLCQKDADDPSLLQMARYYGGLIHASRGNHDEALRLLEAASSGPSFQTQIVSRLTSVMALLGSDPTKRGHEALAVGKALITDLDKPELLADNNYLEFFVSAIYNVATVYLALGDVESAAKEFSRALSFAPPVLQNSIIVRQYDVARDSAERHEIAKKAARVIVDNKLVLAGHKVESLRLSRKSLAKTALYLSKHNLYNELDELINYVRIEFLGNTATIADAVFYMFDLNKSEEKRIEYIGLIEFLVRRHYDNIDDPLIKLRALRIVAIFSTAPEVVIWQVKFLNEVICISSEKSIDNEDCGAIVRIAFSLFGRRAYKELAKLFVIAKELEKRGFDETSEWYGLLSYCEMEFLVQTGKRERASKIAGRLVSLMDKVDASGNVDVSDDFIPEMRRRVFALAPQQKNSSSTKFGRNDWVRVRYGESNVVRKKYKYVEEDLLGGLCDLVAD